MLIYIGNSREARAVFLVSLPFEYMLMLDSRADNMVSNAEN